MKNLKTTQLLFLFTICVLTLVSCDSDNDPTNNVCENHYVNDLITAAYATANGYDIVETMDLETHEYEIIINANGEICSVGYQNPSTYAGGYTMEIINGNTSYTGVHTFSQTMLDYQAITPVAVAVGDVITVRRTILPGYTNLNQTIGRIFRNTNFTNIAYPITEGNVVFQSAAFYGAGGPVLNYGQPHIALGFKVD
ncbi:hypothetical protein FEZ18_05880 [Oceanihabitans sp. IOP_32]|uniref:hypothetical protein n=1 Tax=Oceanihabitans sp. IOP_32 TaxID=2529032 RepID=UPI001293C50E|nr:hypothetical protein [Oceanihabitans sp. IOP_32]QFZ54352.1 hypothetical protein FEZ18_05880 [Oceanihabitans sp. IOP_32]